jgi:uncharacterized phage protein (TIGR01671 family)
MSMLPNLFENIFKQEWVMGERQRELKFRAWDGKTMFDVDVLALTSCSWACPDHGKRGVSFAHQPHIHIMQFAGLLDKNGKEIYEGDIIKWGFGDTLIGRIEWSKTHFKWDIRLLEVYKSPDGLKDFWSDRIEVIGNIYENPELLTPTPPIHL